MAKCNLTAEIKYSWYVRRVYLPSLYLFAEMCDLCGIEPNPDWDLIGKTIAKGAKVKIKVK